LRQQLNKLIHLLLSVNPLQTPHAVVATDTVTHIIVPPYMLY
jgi:hypothetical protein